MNANELTIREQYRRAYRALRVARCYDDTKAGKLRGLFMGVSMQSYAAATMSFVSCYTKAKPTALQKALSQYSELKQAEREEKMLRFIYDGAQKRVDEFEAVLEAAGYHHEANPQCITELIEYLRGRLRDEMKKETA